MRKQRVIYAVYDKSADADGALESVMRLIERVFNEQGQTKTRERSQKHETNRIKASSGLLSVLQ
jgi:hypothetical protein